MSNRKSVSRPRSRAVAPMEPLEGRVLLAVQPLLAQKQSEAATRVSATLLALYDEVLNGRRAAQAAEAAHIRVDANERVSVTIRADDVKRVARGLRAIGFVATASFPKLNFVEGLLPVRAMRVVGSIASRLGQFAVLPNYAPVSFAGAITSQADQVMEADRVRNTPLPASINGAGVKVGVLSDSYNMLGGAAADVASGDLPAGVQVVDEGPADSSDEGRAMLQLIHDLAPGASLAFATAFTGQGGFADNIRALAAAAIGANVIVDDVGYLDEPMFQDGVVAQAIDEVVTTRGVTYFSAAGNQASRAYESTAFTTGSDTITLAGGSILTGNFYDFNQGAGIDTRQRLTLPGNADLRVAFQWDDPFYTANGVNTDLDLFLIDPATGQVVASASSNNLASQRPSEVLQFTNSSASARQLDLVIFHAAGPNAGRIKYVNYGSAGVTINEFATNSPTVIPHAAAVNGQAVAAVPWFNQTAAESFTSKGPSTILFSPTGVRLPAAQVRQTVQIAAIDGVNTTFFGGNDFEGDGFPNFFGTSAAAPHAAAVAALVRQANPTFTPQQVYTRLQQTADDISATGVGYDNVTGHGLVNAYDAVFPTISPASVDFFDGLESGVLSGAYETRSTGNGRILVTGANGPATGSRHITMDTSLATGTFGLNEVTLHVDASGAGGAGDKILSFRQREFAGDEDHVMPASFTNSSNSDGVAISVDGVNWFRLISLTGAASTTSYTQHTINLSAAAAAAGITLTADTRIRFQQYDDFPISLSDGMAFDDIRVVDAAAPRVTDVFVGGSNWTQSFRDFLQSSGQGDATYGYRLTDAQHADELPWINLNQVSVRFSEDVSLAAGAFRVFGLNVPQYAGSITYDATTFTATFQLASGVFAADKLLVALDDELVTDTNGNALDGEWSNPAETTPVTAGGGDTYPSGNGTTGGDFAMRLNVLPGDVTRDGQIVGNDVTSVRGNQGFLPGQGGYTIFRDVTGDARIVGNDVTAVRSRQGIRLPLGEPPIVPA